MGTNLMVFRKKEMKTTGKTTGMDLVVYIYKGKL